MIPGGGALTPECSGNAFFYLFFWKYFNFCWEILGNIRKYSNLYFSIEQWSATDGSVLVYEDSDEDTGVYVAPIFWPIHYMEYEEHNEEVIEKGL